MIGEGKHPCNCCKNIEKCSSIGYSHDCVMHTWGESYCNNYDCLMQREDFCILGGLAEKCGSNPENKVVFFNWEEEEEDEDA